MIWAISDLNNMMILTLSKKIQLHMLSRQEASTEDRPNKDGPCCLGQRQQQAKPEATAHQQDQTISSWG